MPPPETGKQRASRIPLDYYKQPDSLERWKLGLGLAAILVPAGWLGLGLFQRDQGRGNYSRGPVASVHAAWEDNCTACHVPFTPIRGDTWASSLVADPHAGNARCISCHAGPIHHKSQNDDPACASCHRDHRGRDASLVRLPDSDCTQCHDDLAAHRKGGAAGLLYQNEIRRFTKEDHPEFPTLKKPDPGTITFSHKVHMSPGMAAGRGDPKWTLDKIPPEYRERYQGPNDKNGKALVQLQCASCHQLDSGDFKIDRKELAELPEAALLPKRRAGAYMLPINYEKYCQACHPLTFERKKADDPLSGHVAVRHRLQPKAVHDFLEGHYTAQALQGHGKDLEQFMASRPLPGQLLGDKAAPVRKRIEQSVEKAEKLLFSANTCGKCHQDKNPPAEFRLRRIRPAAINEVWFKHAMFNHKAHRAVDCVSCHPQANPKDPRAAETSDVVMLPGIKNCLECHAPPSRSGGVVRGGARFDCTECHRYHGGDDPLHGLGTRQRGPSRLGDIQRFLSGPPDD